MEEITYEDAQKAKGILLQYLTQRVGIDSVTELGHREADGLVYLALSQPYFLD